MKLEGWIAISKDGENWLVAKGEWELKRRMDRYGAIEWKDPISCTITIPDESEVRDES